MNAGRNWPLGPVEINLLTGERILHYDMVSAYPSKIETNSQYGKVTKMQLRGDESKLELIGILEYYVIQYITDESARGVCTAVINALKLKELVKE